MKFRTAVWMLGLLLLAVPAMAADVDGKWTGSIDTPNGAFPVIFVFKAEGSSLTGSTGPTGVEVPIKKGKIDGNQISFDLDVDFGGMSFTFSYTGVVSPTEIKLRSEIMGMPFEYVVKKAS
jgi:hypothetical protein